VDEEDTGGDGSRRSGNDMILMTNGRKIMTAMRRMTVALTRKLAMIVVVVRIMFGMSLTLLKE
jgi:hypothetical protein